MTLQLASGQAIHAGQNSCDSSFRCKVGQQQRAGRRKNESKEGAIPNRCKLGKLALLWSLREGTTLFRQKGQGSRCFSLFFGNQSWIGSRLELDTSKLSCSHLGSPRSASAHCVARNFFVQQEPLFGPLKITFFRRPLLELDVCEICFRSLRPRFFGTTVAAGAPHLQATLLRCYPARRVRQAPQRDPRGPRHSLSDSLPVLCS